ncbi:uncharacterized protein LOC144058472 isoform X1 [Vanacampus margaritifer]
MFYYPAVLKRDSGCFSTIWLAATRGITVPRREFLKVNVKRTCDDIISYILVQVPPPQPNLPRPRFSLYLSSQLQYGVVVVFHRQCVIFLKELQYIVGQLLKKSRSKGLDMKDPGRQMTLFTDPMARLDEIDGGLDPLFGEMDEFRPSPSVLMQEIPEQGAFSAEIQPLTPARSASPINRITASREQITMNDLELIFAPEFSGQDLDDNVEDTLEVLLAQTDNFLTELLRPEAAPAAEAEVERAPVREPSPATATTATALTVGPTTVSSQEQDLTLHPQDETQGMPQSLAEEMTPVGTLPPVSSSATDAAQESAVAEGAPHPEETEPKRKKKRAAGRQLIFFDPLTQIPHDKLQQQIRDPLLETRIRPFLPPESHRLKSARELLSQPCGGQFRSDPLPSCTRWTRRGPITGLTVCCCFQVKPYPKICCCSGHNPPPSRPSTTRSCYPVEEAWSPAVLRKAVPWSRTAALPRCRETEQKPRRFRCQVSVHFHWRHPSSGNPLARSPPCTRQSKKAGPGPASNCRTSLKFRKRCQSPLGRRRKLCFFTLSFLQKLTAGVSATFFKTFLTFWRPARFVRIKWSHTGTSCSNAGPTTMRRLFICEANHSVACSFYGSKV